MSYLLAAGSTVVGGDRGLAAKLPQAVHPLGRTLQWAEHSGHSMVHHRVVAGDVAGDDGQAAAHRLEKGVRHAFVAGGIQQDVG